MTTDNQSITRMIWLASQIKNCNGLVEVMPSIVLSPDPNMQAKRKSIQQQLDMENGYNILETKKLKLKGTKYVRECYARKRLQLKKQQAQFWKSRSCRIDFLFACILGSGDRTINGIASTKQL